MYDDFYSDFRKFFRPDLYLGTKLLDDLAYFLKPRYIKGTFKVEKDTEYHGDDSSVIYREGGEVLEMLFINQGECSVGYSYYQNQKMEHRRTHLTHVFGKKDFLGEQYVLYNMKSQFHYEAKTDVMAYALSKFSFMTLLNNDYPNQMLRDFQERAARRHDDLVQGVYWHKERHLIEMNSNAEYDRLIWQPKSEPARQGVSTLVNHTTFLKFQT